MVYIYASVYVLTVKQYLAIDAAALDEVVHAVQGLKEGGFAAARRAYEGGYLLFLNVHVYALEGVKIAVVEI